MKIKKIYTVFISLILLLSVSSCNNWLDVEPESQIILENYWKSETDVQSVLASCYKSLTKDEVIYRMIVWGELRSDNMTVGNGSGNYDMYEILNGNLTSSNFYAHWGGFYTTINYCNTVLYYAPYVLTSDNNFTVDDLHRVQAEAKSVRALAYFYLVRAFRDVPYITNPTIDDTQDFNQPKTSETVVLDSLITDLKFAQQYAIQEYGERAKNKGRITRNAINALLADIYLWKSSDKDNINKTEDLNKCIEACDLVINGNEDNLVEGRIMFQHVFSLGNSSESIFELQFDEYQQKNNAVRALYGNSNVNYGQLALPTTLGYNYVDGTAGPNSPFGYKVNSIIESVKDVRARDFVDVNEGGKSGKYYIFKYAGRLCTEIPGSANPLTYTWKTSTSNWIIYRLSDVMLMKAEALAELEGNDEYKKALIYVNKVYRRSNIGVDSLKIQNYASKAEVQQLVLRERQRELMFEGKRWFDLVRLAKKEGDINSLNSYVNHKLSATGSTSTAQTMDAMYMPISKSEIEANPNLKQNPYYEETSTSIR